MEFKISKANRKLAKMCHDPHALQYLPNLRPSEIASFSLPAGKSCPGAKLCRAFVVEEHGRRRLVEGVQAEFQCFSALQERQYSATYDQRDHNMKALDRALSGTQQDRHESALRFIESMPMKTRLFRWHVSGDIMSLRHALWIWDVARLSPWVRHYLYTKSTRHVGPLLGFMPSNLRVNLSIGGRWDDEVDHLQSYNPYSVGVAVVVADEECGLPIDTTDAIAAFGHHRLLETRGRFGLVLHGDRRSSARDRVRASAAAELAWTRAYSAAEARDLEPVRT